MLWTLLGLLLAALFGVFFGSEGEMDPQLFSLIFWGLIAAGVLGNALVILKELIVGRYRGGPQGFHFHHHNRSGHAT